MTISLDYSIIENFGNITAKIVKPYGKLFGTIIDFQRESFLVMLHSTAMIKNITKLKHDKIKHHFPLTNVLILVLVRHQ